MNWQPAKLAAAAVLIWASGAATGWITNDAKDVVIEIPCDEHEVAVWTDFDAGEYACVSGTDHTAHLGE